MVDCLYCNWAKASGELPDHNKKELLASYHDVRNYWFHCEKPTHVTAFHKVVGPLSKFSCSCHDRQQLGVPYDINFDIDWDDSH